MEKDKSPGHGRGLPPHTSRYTSFASPSSSFPMKPELSPSCPPGSSAAPESSQFGQDSCRFSQDVSRMPDFPPRNIGHRRAHSEILSLPDDISFDSDLGVVGGADGTSLSDETEEDFFSMYIDVGKFSSSSAASGSDMPAGEPSGTVVALHPPPLNENIASNSNERPRGRHQHSQSMDGSTSINPELLLSGSEGPSFADTKKAMSTAKLADLALVDPKRAKRIWANRQSAARSKERKMRYISELERKVQTLQTEATTLSAQFTLLQRDTNGLTAENNELKLRLQTMEQQVHLQDALNDALREEVQRLKLVTGQALPSGGQMMNFCSPPFGANPQLYHNHPGMQSLLTAHQLQQLQLHSQHPQQVNLNHHHQQQQQQQQQPLADLKIKPPMTSQNQNHRES